MHISGSLVLSYSVIVPGGPVLQVQIWEKDGLLHYSWNYALACSAKKVNAVQ